MEPSEIIEAYRVGSPPLMLLGTYEKGVTVYAQQVRALNLAYGLVDGDFFPKPSERTKPYRIAIVGGGFAGLTFAAAMIAKGVEAKLDVFEKRDTLLPLQHGSDGRWLHPRIYDWPTLGSTSQVAMLPLLNWTAGRASDVVVQVLSEWKRVATPWDLDDTTKSPSLRVFCNARHLQIEEMTGSGQLRIEWVGERRAADGTLDSDHATPRGDSADYDLVVIAMGFGLERDQAHSYWRNDVAGQPGLDAPRRTYIVSGQGDGAMIDLLRIRVGQFRQDRILDELFSERRQLLSRLQELSDKTAAEQFENFETLWRAGVDGDLQQVGAALALRLRRDTDAILHLRSRRMMELFTSPTLRISFQNKLLVYLLYKCGGFVPSDQSLRRLKREYGVEEKRVILRHGTDGRSDLAAVLSKGMADLLRARGEDPVAGKFPGRQPSEIAWPGGFFGFAGRSADRESLPQTSRATWRKEYLPDATNLLTSGLSSAIAGLLITRKRPSGRMRVTLHRALSLPREELLQQCCEYAGHAIEDAMPGAGRTLSTDVATIGQAYETHRIVRSIKKVDAKTLDDSMRELKLNVETREMSKGVSFLAAIPILEPENAGGFVGKSPVAGVVYLDAKDDDFYLEDDDLSDIVGIVQNWLAMLERRQSFGRIQNCVFPVLRTAPNPGGPLSAKAKALEVVESVAPPRSVGPFQINFDYTDLAALSSQSPESAKAKQ